MEESPGLEPAMFEYKYADGTHLVIAVQHSGDTQVALGMLHHVQTKLDEAYAEYLKEAQEPYVITTLEENAEEEENN